MKVNILYEFKPYAYGGANQFLKGLKKALIHKNIYEGDFMLANTILINLSPENFWKNFSKIFKIIIFKRNTKIINRIDGPVGLIRKSSLFYDYIFLIFSKFFCDGIIYQSKWSEDKLSNLGIKLNLPKTNILNGCDTSIFNFKKNEKKSKLKIVASSWSDNMGKGFKHYQWLDQNLNFSKYDFFFVGNSPIKFKNIKQTPPLSSKDLADFYKRMNIYITASKNDPCSNSLIEAMSCGLIPISLEDGGHSEINTDKNLNFSDQNEIIECIKYVENNFSILRDQIIILDIKTQSEKYISFVDQISIRKKIFYPLRILIIFLIFISLIFDKLLTRVKIILKITNSSK